MSFLYLHGSDAISVLRFDFGSLNLHGTLLLLRLLTYLS